MDSAAIKRLAEILVNHSTKVKKGDHVLIAGSDLARPLIEEIYRLVMRKGGYPLTYTPAPSLNRIFFEEASEEQLDHLHPAFEAMYFKDDVIINIMSSENTRSLTGVDPNKQQRYGKTAQPLSKHMLEGGVRWNVTLFPTQAQAQDAGMSLDEYADFVFGATNIDWTEALAMMQKVKAVFDAGDQVRLVGKDTDLALSLKGRQGIIDGGEKNMPGGEVFYSPVEDSVNGHIYYEYPAIYSGREVSGIRLTFKDGKVTEATADKGQDFLLSMLDSDAGSRFLGELGIGCNYGIQKFTRNILFDEKIGGTVHLAVGNGFSEVGGKNESAVHWDMVKELREGGEIYLDGKLVAKNGKFLFL